MTPCEALLSPVVARLRAPLRYLAPLAALALLLGGCSALDTTQVEGGLPARHTGKVSLIVAQTRAQYPQLSAVAVPYSTRQAGQAADQAPELALRGEGVGVARGVPRSDRPSARVHLYLNKHSYAAGHAEVALNGEDPADWRIVAYTKSGAAAEDFAFTYVLADPQGRVRYLEVVGGGYERAGTAFIGYEGTLIIPGPGGDLERWETAYKLDFGYAFPQTPAYQQQVAQADGLYRALQRDMDAVSRLRGRLARAREALAAKEAEVARAEAAAVNPPASGADTTAAETATPAAPPPTADAERAAVADLEAQIDQRLRQAEQRMERYYSLREAIAGTYADFVQTNQYLWRDQAGRQAFYDEWKVVEGHHDTIDKLADRLASLLPDPGPLNARRKQAMDVVVATNNWGKAPGSKAN